MHPNKALGPDGFPASFFQHYWEIVGVDVVVVIEDSREIGKVLKEINNTFIALILKKEKPKRLEEFLPIALFNTIYKVLEKDVENQINKILPK